MLPAKLAALGQWIAARRRILVLTGAGCSTESGIPDYRDADGTWKRPPPMNYQQFIASEAARRRYWARATIGWRHLRSVQPGVAHRNLAWLESVGRVQCLITQNVDGLHQRAGSHRVIDLHGRIDSVVCLGCRQRFDRESIQVQLETRNAVWLHRVADPAPDGDCLIGEEPCETFSLVSCPQCGGVLKPAVVFFGESVPAERVRQAYRAVEEADGLLIVGSSLMVYSGYRFARAAAERGVAIAMINLGRTRADALVALKVEAACGAVLDAVRDRMLVSGRRESGDGPITAGRSSSLLNQDKPGEP